VAAELVALDEVTRTLRERCPWDVEQTHATLRRYVLEEAQEVAEAIDSGDPAKLEEELGDLLYQVYFHATLGAEEGDYTLADVARGIREKLVRRHPHVFGDEHAETLADVGRIWERVKAEERDAAQRTRHGSAEMAASSWRFRCGVLDPRLLSTNFLNTNNRSNKAS
jgi:MazG family protein